MMIIQRADEREVPVEFSCRPLPAWIQIPPPTEGGPPDADPDPPVRPPDADFPVGTP